jgi:hypothetical protein
MRTLFFLQSRSGRHITKIRFIQKTKIPDVRPPTMMARRRLIAALAASFSVGGLAFQAPKNYPKVHSQPLRLASENNEEKSNSTPRSQSRRTFFKTISLPVVLGGASTSTLATTTIANAETPPKILVLGGTGFVGSRVVSKLNDLGVQVIATSRNGREGTVAFDVTSEGINVEKEIENLAKGCTGVISCIGVIGTEKDATVNAASGLAAIGAKASGVDRFVYIAVAPEVKAFAEGIEFLKPYMTGKTFSQDAVASNFPTGSTLIEPTFIYGGDSFNVNPPRVAGFYGEFIETLLSSTPIRAANNITPGGVVKIALEPPVSVGSVAGAAVAGALGKTQGTLDTHDAIKMAGTLLV